LAQHLGHYTLILSNSPSFLVSVFARCFGVDDWKATRYAIDHQENLSHIDVIFQGEEKAKYVNEIASQLHISKEDVTAYSDSYLDLPFLLTAGTPIAVNPDRKLKKYSESHSWTVL
jgi:phosphoserine phosphatase